MSEIWFAADTHFGHRNIIRSEAEARPFSTIEQHDEELVRRWNSVVSPDDIVYHLGDVAFGLENIATCGRLNGRLRLVMGNHDNHPVQAYLEYFESVHALVSFKGQFLLSHAPLHPTELVRNKINVHGHLHSEMLTDARYVCVSLEHTGLAPTNRDQILARAAAASQRMEEERMARRHGYEPARRPWRVKVGLETRRPAAAGLIIPDA